MEQLLGKIARALCCFYRSVCKRPPSVSFVKQVAAEVEEMRRDESSEFGEFVRLQSAALEDCEGKSFEELLLVPARRILEYPSLFRVSVA